jgi:hypothetical protein
MRDLQFATWQMIMRLVGAPKGVKTWHCPLPNHRDANPSFSAGPGREPGTTVVACSCGQRKELLAYFFKLGYRLGPMKMVAPKRPKRPVEVATSVAFRAVTRAEQTMYALIAAGGDPSYDEFEAAGVHRQAIPGGLRVLQALGLCGVIRNPREKGCRRYGRNECWTVHQWRRWEPSGGGQRAMLAAENRAGAVARAARKGGEDISAKPAGKTEVGRSGLRVPEVRVRGTDSGTVTYVERRLASLSQDSERPETQMKGEDSGGARADARGRMHQREVGDNGRWRPPCGGIDCFKNGECLHHEWCPAERLGKSNGDGWPSR